MDSWIILNFLLFLRFIDLHDHDQTCQHPWQIHTLPIRTISLFFEELSHEPHSSTSISLDHLDTSSKQMMGHTGSLSVDYSDCSFLEASDMLACSLLSRMHFGIQFLIWPSLERLWPFGKSQFSCRKLYCRIFLPCHPLLTSKCNGTVENAKIKLFYLKSISKVKINKLKILTYILSIDSVEKLYRCVKQNTSISEVFVFNTSYAELASFPLDIVNLEQRFSEFCYSKHADENGNQRDFCHLFSKFYPLGCFFIKCFWRYDWQYRRFVLAISFIAFIDEIKRTLSLPKKKKHELKNWQWMES